MALENSCRNLVEIYYAVSSGKTSNLKIGGMSSWSSGTSNSFTTMKRPQWEACVVHLLLVLLVLGPLWC